VKSAGGCALDPTRLRDRTRRQVGVFGRSHLGKNRVRDDDAHRSDRPEQIHPSGVAQEDKR